MDTFHIWPSEALIFGMLYADASTAVRVDPGIRFFQRFFRRLESFIERPEIFCRRKEDLSKRTVHDLLFDYLHQFLAVTRYEAMRFPADEAAFERIWTDQLTTAERHALTVPEKLDDLEGVETALRCLIEANGLRGYFETGVAFGQVFNAASAYEYDLHNWDPVDNEPEIFPKMVNEVDWRPMSRDSFQKSVRASIESIRAQEWLMSCSVANDLAKSIVWSTCCFFDDIGFDIDPLNRLRDEVGILFGLAIAQLRAADLDSQQMDSRSAVPRSMRLSSSASMDRVGGQLTLVQSEIAKERHTMPPEAVLAMLVNSIESLVSNAWTKELQGSVRVDDLLREKRARGNSIEKKFANIALALHSEYRNMGAHPRDSFQCTWEDVNHFYSGLRVLRELVPRVRSSFSAK